MPDRIDGMKIWVGVGLTGGDYRKAEKIGTIKYKSGVRMYAFYNVQASGSSVEIQAGEGKPALALAEVQIYEGPGW